VKQTEVTGGGILVSSGEIENGLAFDSGAARV